jgi:putative transposase
MFTTIFLLFSSIRQGFRTRAAPQAEILALRHQLLVLQRSNRGHRLRLGRADRLLWVWLSRLWSGWQAALVIVKPETVIAWHRQGFRLLSLAKTLTGRRISSLQRCFRP